MAEEPFAYNDSQWAAILAELPKCDSGACSFLQNAANSFVQEVRWSSGTTPTFKREQVAWDGVVKTVAKLESQLRGIRRTFGSIAVARVLGRTSDRDRVEDGIKLLRSLPEKRIQELADFQVENPKRSNASDPCRDAFLEALLFEWEHEGGRLSTSIDPYNNRATGPLVRYLFAASSPVFEASGRPPMTPNALVHFVRLVRKARSRSSKT